MQTKPLTEVRGFVIRPTVGRARERLVRAERLGEFEYAL